jgi:hypothetical protein
MYTMFGRGDEVWALTGDTAVRARAAIHAANFTAKIEAPPSG